MATCTRCGSENNTTARFCHNCGQDLTKESSLENSAVTQNVPSPLPYERSNGRRRPNNKTIAVVVVAVVAILLASVAIAINPQIAGVDSSANPSAIYSFYAQDEGSQFTFYFVLVNQNHQQIASDGNVHVLISDNDGFTIFEDNFTIQSSDFDDITTLLGVDYLAYVWSTPYSSMNKTESQDYTLNAEMTFTKGSTVLSAQAGYVWLPDALRATYQNPESITINSDGIWSVSGYNYNNGDFYINLTMRNTGNSTISVWSSFFKVEDSTGARYSYNGVEDAAPSELTKGASATWTVFFEVPSGVTPTKLVYDDRVVVSLSSQSEDRSDEGSDQASSDNDTSAASCAQPWPARIDNVYSPSSMIAGSAYNFTVQMWVQNYRADCSATPWYYSKDTLLTWTLTSSNGESFTYYTQTGENGTCSLEFTCPSAGLWHVNVHWAGNPTYKQADLNLVVQAS